MLRKECHVLALGHFSHESRGFWAEQWRSPGMLEGFHGPRSVHCKEHQQEPTCFVTYERYCTIPVGAWNLPLHFTHPTSLNPVSQRPCLEHRHAQDYHILRGWKIRLVKDYIELNLQSLQAKNRVRLDPVERPCPVTRELMSHFTGPWNTI